MSKRDYFGNKGLQVWCKGCGGFIVDRGRRLPSYIEVKLECEDGSAHVTSLCKGCAYEDIPLWELQEFYDIDRETMVDMKPSYDMGDRKVIKVVEIGDAV